MMEVEKLRLRSRDERKDSIEKFEVGMQISKECKDMLDNVEKRITILIDGEEKDFKPEEE